MLVRASIQMHWIDNNFPPDKYAAILQAHLTGKALKGFTELSVEESRDYPALKAALLQAYSVVPEVYRKRFRNLSKLYTQSYSEFAFRLSTQFGRWLESELGLRVPGNLPVSYVLTGNLPVTYHQKITGNLPAIIILFIFLSFRSTLVAIPALNRTTNPKTNHNPNPTYRNYPTNPN